AEKDKPTLIICKTIIGYGSPNKQNTHDSHGAPLGDEEIALTRQALNWNHAPFEIPADIYEQWNAHEKGQAAENAWNDKFAAYEKAYPELAAEFKRRLAGELPANWAAESQAFVEKLQANPASIASRKASQNAIEA
ncbi:transketolase, partial [Tessaracoccus sp. OH4464_COT-324]